MSDSRLHPAWLALVIAVPLALALLLWWTFGVLDWTPDHPERLMLVWVVPLVGVGLFLMESRNQGALGELLSPVMQRRLTAQASAPRIVGRLCALLAAMVGAVFAVAQPQLKGTLDETTSGDAGASVMFVLDTSRSMLAEDAAPNRLARAKADIARLITNLDDEHLNNTQVGLVAFAGRAVQVCPLTADHAYFSTVLSTIDTRSAGRGGTKVGEAIKAGVRGFPPEASTKLMVLITDGDDQDPYTEESAKVARDAGIKIIAIGLGSETGSEIKLTDPTTKAKTTLMYEGKPVISKLDAATLRKVSAATEGIYVPAGTAAIDLSSIMTSYVKPMVEAAATGKRPIVAERFFWPLLLAFGCVLASLWAGRTP